MNRVYGEPVMVQARADGRPLRFVWRSRLYIVHAICEHWVVNREWWRARDDSGGPAQPGPGSPQPGPGPPQPGPGEPELEFWRVEAAPGQGMTPGTFELRQDAATAVWTLRVS